MNQLPRITFVTPSYQQAKYLERTIRSVLDQGYPNLEYFVLDGGSNDGSVEIIKKYADRIQFWTSEKDGGQSAAINRGLRMATGEIVGWLNSDDTLAPGALHRIGRFYARHPNADLIYGHTCTIDVDDRVIRPLVAVPTNAKELIRYTHDLWSQPGTSWRRNLHDRLGYLDESLQCMMDGDWWIRVARTSQIRLLPVHLGNLRIHGESKTSSASLRARWDAEQEILDQRYGYMLRGGLERRWFYARRLARILRSPRSLLYRLRRTL
ncbi:glycosyltransferase family 2 protein [Humisphaera borealis]|uniref:Glycosyltransferase n=1 Tax=Humisphaera borealis TaxID=2807512 RepID=A0A7M2X128_9BACT|nr:glycosyltransferase family 2 protein [Humisphaera borealis]QOV91403.1 glycosyltransferase [Humisphaera borealis]